MAEKDEWSQFPEVETPRTVPLPLVPFTTDWSQFPLAQEVQKPQSPDQLTPLAREFYDASPEPSYLTVHGANLMQGYGDEAKSYVQAARRKVSDLFNWEDGPSFGEAQKAALEAERFRLDKYARENPNKNLAASVTGSVHPWLLAGGPLLSGGSGLAGRAGIGAVEGAGIGALQGFGHGEGGFIPRVESGAYGGLFGGLLGGALPVAGSAVGGLIGSPAAREVVETFDRTGVEPNITTAFPNRGTGTVASIVGDSFFGSSIPEQYGRQLTQAGSRLDDIAGMASPVREPTRAGETVQSGAERFATERVPVPAGKSAASLPSRATSFKTKAEALYDRVGKMIPRGRTTYLGKTRQALTQIESRFANPELQDAFKNADVDRVADRIRAAGDAGVSWKDLRSLRTAVRDYLENDEVLKSVPKAELDKLYSALTDDMYTMALNSGKRGSKKQGQKILHAVQMADRFYAAGAERIRTVLDKVIKGKSGDNVYESLARMAREGSGADWRRMASVRRSLGDGEWDEVVSTVVSRLGRSPKTGEAWSPNYFLNNLKNMTPQSAQILFGGTRYQGLRPAIDDLMKVAEELKRVQQLGNPSGSGRYAGHALALGGLYYGTQDIMTTLGAALVSAGGHLGAARVLSSPKAVRWLTGAMRIAGNPNSRRAFWGPHVAGLETLVRENPEIGEPLRAAADAIIQPQQ